MAGRSDTRRRRDAALGALAIAAITVMAGACMVQASNPPTLPSSVHLDQWETKPQGD